MTVLRHAATSAERAILPVLLALHVLSCAASDPPRNVILFIADGCGFATFTMGRDYAAASTGAAPVFDSLLTGSTVTRPSHGRITDSAAAATALACGIRTRNGQIATDTTGAPVATVLEAAERAGYRTGLVSTARITHATPAGFSAHVVDRGEEDEIAVQQLAQGIEVLLGGGLDHFLPAGGGGSRRDGRNLLDEARAMGYTVVLDSEGLEDARSLPVLGLFDASHVDYDIDLDEGNEPSLAAMTRRTLELLDGGEAGFFVMVEAGRIDHAAHGFDAAAHVHDLQAYDRAMQVALDFARRDGSTLIVATSDHETGGLTLGRDGVYAWHPEAIATVNRSFEVFRERLRPSLEGVQGEAEAMEAVVTLATQSGMGPFDSADLDRVREAVEAGLSSGRPASATADRAAAVIADILNRRAGIGWTTSGHTAVDVPMYAWGPGSESFSGTLENAEFGRRLARVLGVDLEPLTRELRESASGD